MRLDWFSSRWHFWGYLIVLCFQGWFSSRWYFWGYLFFISFQCVLLLVYIRMAMHFVVRHQNFPDQKNTNSDRRNDPNNMQGVVVMSLVRIITIMLFFGIFWPISFTRRTKTPAWSSGRHDDFFLWTIFVLRTRFGTWAWRHGFVMITNVGTRAWRHGFVLITRFVLWTDIGDQDRPCTRSKYRLIFVLRARQYDAKGYIP